MSSTPRHPRPTRLVWASAIGAAAMLAHTHAQAQPSTPPSQSPREQPDPLLTGPSVADQTPAMSLVRIGYDGRLAELDAPAPIAALDLLGLSPEERASAESVLHERAVLIDQIVAANVRLLSGFEATMQSGTPAEKASLLTTGLAELEPALRWGRLDHRLEAVLSPPAAHRYRELLDGYFTARLDRPGPDGGGVLRLRLEIYGEQLRWEIQQSAQRLFGQADDQWLERLTVAVGLSDGQRAAIRTKAEAWFFETGARPTKAQERALIESIAAELTWWQRIRLARAAARGELEPRH